MRNQAAARGVAPLLEPIEEGGDFFQLSRVREHRKEATGRSRGRQSVISVAQQSLVDLLATKVTKEGGLPYDAIAFAPTTIKRLTKNPKSAKDWAFDISNVDERLDFHTFVRRLIDVAKYRGFV